jgi:predicted nucleic acid-binding protein
MLAVGCVIGAETDAELFAAETLFESMRRIDLSADIARRAVELRRQLRLKLPDAILLATADREGCILVTRNAKDFDADDPRVRIPYQLRELLAEKPSTSRARRSGRS